MQGRILFCTLTLEVLKFTNIKQNITLYVHNMLSCKENSSISSHNDIIVHTFAASRFRGATNWLHVHLRTRYVLLITSSIR